MKIAVIGLLILAGCQSSQQFQENLARTCAGLAQAYASYDIVAASGLVSERTIKKVEAIRVQTDLVCADPQNANAVSLTALAAGAYIALNKAFKEGREHGDAQTGYVRVENLRKFLERM